MPGCKMSFKKSAGGGKRIGGSGVSVGAYGMEINPETAYFGGDTGPAMSKRAEPAVVPKSTGGKAGSKSGGMFG